MDQQQPKKKWSKKQKTWAVIGILLFVALIASCGKPQDQSGNESATPGAKTQDKETAVTYRPNEDVRVGDVRWKLLSARDRGNTLKASESRYPTIATTKTSPGRYIEITMEVENLGTELKSVTNLQLVDDKGREYSHATDVSEWIPKGKELYILSNLNPNVPAQFADLYEVPADATGLRVKVGDLKFFGSKEALIDTEIK